MYNARRSHSVSKAHEQLRIGRLGRRAGGTPFVVQSVCYSVCDRLTLSPVGVDRLLKRSAHSPFSVRPSIRLRPPADDSVTTRATVNGARRFGGRFCECIGCGLMRSMILASVGLSACQSALHGFAAHKQLHGSGSCIGLRLLGLKKHCIR